MGAGIRLAAALAVCAVGIWLFADRTLQAEWIREIHSVLDGRQESESPAGKDANPAGKSGNPAWESESPAGQAEPQPLSVLSPDLTRLYSPYAVLVDCETGTVLAEHNGRERMYPASLTKIMTAWLAAENLSDLQEKITLTTDMFTLLYTRHASVAGFEPGDEVSVEDLLYGILLPSGAECSIACAERIAGTQEAFTERMNRKADELGLSDTHFENCTGLHEQTHYSTAADMALLLQNALQNQVFRDVFTSKSHRTAAVASHPEGLEFENTMFALLGTEEIRGGGILGGKTGFTDQAGLCLASLARIDEREYILVTAKADGSHRTPAYHVLDALAVYRQIGS